MRKKFQDLSRFRVPAKFRGKSRIIVQLWWIVQSTFFSWSPQFAYSWRAFLLRSFGAQVGNNSRIRSSARFTYPWKISLGHNCWIGDRAELYSLTDISIGNDCCISQDCYLAAASHDINKLEFDYIIAPIIIEDEVWLASGVFVVPGITIGRGCVVGARSIVTSTCLTASIMIGHPAKKIGVRSDNRQRTQ
jgi:putative colanic acid biosynthesis acetyltransferase WcaF